MRNIPDVAGVAYTVFLVFTSRGSSVEDVVGGTSCAAPMWAGFAALVNQQNTLGRNLRWIPEPGALRHR